jgi:hypothetical protein
VVVHEVSASVEIRTITGMDFRSEGNTMMWCDCQGFELENCFATREAAQARADELLANRRAEEAKAFANKEKPERTWAWNTTYHRQRLKQALKDAEYHKSKLEVCKLHSKDVETVKTT